MLTTPKKNKKTLLLHKVTAIILFLALSACSSTEPPKVVRRYNNNGQDCPTGTNCFSKPTPQAGINAPAYMGLSLTAQKSTARVLDIALNGTKSSYIHKCQTLQYDIEGDTAEKLTLSTNASSCKNLAGTETIKVTYADSERGANKKIVKIEKLRQHGIRVSNTANARTSRHLTLAEDIIITLKEDSIYTVDYRANLDTSVNSTNNANNVAAPNKQVSTSSILIFLGQVNLVDFTWQMNSLSLDLAKYIESNLDFQTSFIITPSDASQRSALICGLPIGQFIANQKITKNTKTENFAPIFNINEKGEINVQGENTKFKQLACSTQGFKDLEDTVFSTILKITR
ncbi:MAG: hypothetical protein A2Z20_08420 [Bdellovibrionales bacterium RBG_16_40_8]|nr:MAG: hypothetical protein A2Z20_08420 [Bdellovibrionales bacterium RBG_16_40_8]